MKNETTPPTTKGRPAKNPALKRRKVTISLPPTMLDQLQGIAYEKGVSVSEWLESAARSQLSESTDCDIQSKDAAS